MLIKESRRYQSISRSFKVTVVTLLFALTVIRLSLVVYFPGLEIIPDKFFLLVILLILFYLWVQELIDFHNILEMHKDLSLVHEELKNAQIDTIAALIKTVEEKDFYTHGHSERVTKIALKIAEEMNLSEEAKSIINKAGILHDIGKIGISDAILNKKEKLTPEEWEEIKRHPANAVAILQPLKFLSSEREIILQHHERFDGKGYPRGLKGGEICLEANIIAVADTFDAMYSKRAYRDSLTKETILQELQKSRGTQHSPMVIDVFLPMLEKDPELWAK
ncbi:MAG: hypothetical protein DRP74_07095 [Candidatus Omnitrophota bacterium]|nr:MAG: hypothetical protein DRP74_07095 [Candidatus Omnitrophota bacterium]